MVEALVIFWNILKKLLGYVHLWQKFALPIKSRMNFGLQRRMHVEVVEPIRSLHFDLIKGINPENNMERLTSALDSIESVVADFLEIDSCQLHCTLKVFEGGDDAIVYTLARSSDKYRDWPGRNFDTGRDDKHLVAENTSFASIIGVSDRKNKWATIGRYPCFICGDLKSAQNYDSSRLDWEKHYNATVVFPIQFARKPTDGSQSSEPNLLLGFITFDAKQNVFGKLGEIDVFNQNNIDYISSIAESTFFHVCASISDNLAPYMYLRAKLNTPNTPVESK